jgi:hypothetical protein
MIVELVIVAAVVFGINLLPAFGPPTWAVLVYFRFRYGDIPERTGQTRRRPSAILARS